MAFINIKTAEQLAQEEFEQALERAKSGRASAYTQESDPVFFKAQRGEATIEEWQAKVDEIRTRYPYPESD